VPAIHQVAIRITNTMGGDDWHMLSKKAFLNKPTAEQIELVLQGDVKFYDDAGVLIPVEDAVASIGSL